MVFTYYMHTKELHAIFQNHASYQASWISTSTACNSYPHKIHGNIFSIHIPTSFSQKKKNCMLFKPRNQHANWIFFFQFSQLRKKEKQHEYTKILLTKKKIGCYSNQEINMQTGFFFFQFSSSEKQHAYTNIILTKNCMLFKPRN